MILRLLKTAWSQCKTIDYKIGDFQARLLLSIFYFVVLGPYPLSVRILSGPKRINSSD